MLLEQVLLDALAVNGSLRQINIIDRGFDYIENPTISITGGNGDNAKGNCYSKVN